MDIIKISVRTSFVILTALILASACKSGNKLAKRANEAFEIGEYHKALGMYEKLQERESGNKQRQAELAFKIGQCHDILRDSRKAESRYMRAYRRGYEKPPIYTLLADKMLMNENYDQAQEFYQLAIEKHPLDARAKHGLASVELARAWLDSATRYQVENIREMNSRSNEFAPAYARPDYSLVYYTSTRGDEGRLAKLSDITGQQYADIYEIRQDRQGKWGESSLLQDTTVNSEFDDGAITFSNDKNTLYYTACSMEPAKNLGCQIFYVQSRGSGWGNPAKLILGPDSISVGHPSISDCGLELYFSARMPGGLGGADIWYVKRSSPTGSWSAPVNAGPDINSPGDELFPYIRSDGNLYFSSDFWPGFGGLDIFRAIKNAEGAWVVSNMMPPINSPQDDFGIVFQGAKETGLLSSSRRGGRGGDDIYSFHLPDMEFYAEGSIVSRSSGKGIEGAKVTVFGSDGSVTEADTRAGGTYRVKLEQYVDYIILGSAEGYLRKKTRISTANLTDNKTFNERLELIQSGETVAIPNIFYDFGKWTLNEHSKAALVELAELLEDNPNVTIELGAHTDMVGDSASNMMLSKRRAQSIIDYLNEKGYDPGRLVARGYGEDQPVTVSRELAAQHPGLEAGRLLCADYIGQLPDELRDAANAANRRTELKVLSMDYMPRPEHFVRHRKRVKGIQ
jgi:peptidoglycan-associated lipoprotein